MLRLESENNELKNHISSLELHYDRSAKEHQERVHELRKRIDTQINKENVGDNQIGCIVSLKSRTCS